MKYRLLLTLALFLAIPHLVKAQSFPGLEVNRHVITYTPTVNQMFDNAVVIVGSPFLHNEWSNGSLVTASGNLISDVDMKFEGYSNMLVIIYNEDSVAVRPEMVPEFSYYRNGESFVFRNSYIAPEVNVLRNRYIRVLHETEDGWSLYADMGKRFLRAEPPKAYDSHQRDNEFVDNVRYLARSPQGEWSEFRPTQRGVSRLLDVNSRTLRGFMRDENLSYNKATDLARIFEFVNNR